MVILILIGFKMSFNIIYYTFLILPSYLVIYQIKTFDPNNPNKCLHAFKSNNLLGLIIFVNILIGKLIL